MLKITFACIALFLSSSIFAELYKWTDSSGAVHFSDQVHNGYNEEKINISPSNSMKGIDPNFILNSYINELINKAEEMNNEAKSCYYNATERKIMDISCKNFKTLLDRDFIPLVSKIKDFIRSNPGLKSIEAMNQKIDELKDIAREAEENYKSALKYLLYLYESK